MPDRLQRTRGPETNAVWAYLRDGGKGTYADIAGRIGCSKSSVGRIARVVGWTRDGKTAEDFEVLPIGIKANWFSVISRIVEAHDYEVKARQQMGSDALKLHRNDIAMWISRLIEELPSASLGWPPPSVDRNRKRFRESLEGSLLMEHLSAWHDFDRLGVHARLFGDFIQLANRLMQELSTAYPSGARGRLEGFANSVYHQALTSPAKSYTLREHVAPLGGGWQITKGAWTIHVAEVESEVPRILHEWDEAISNARRSGLVRRVHSSAEAANATRDLLVENLRLLSESHQVVGRCRACPPLA